MSTTSVGGDSYRARSGQSWKSLGREAVVLDLAAGSYYSLNEVGAFIWRQLQQPIGVPALAAALCEAFEVDEHAANMHAQAFVDALIAQGLIEPCP